MNEGELKKRIRELGISDEMNSLELRLAIAKGDLTFAQAKQMQSYREIKQAYLDRILDEAAKEFYGFGGYFNSEAYYQLLFKWFGKQK